MNARDPDIETTRRPPVALRQRLGEKLPEILIEAGSVLLALLLAFAANAWHEHSQDVDRAEKARAAILAEMKENRVEVARSRDAVRKMQSELDLARQNMQPVKQMSLEFGLALVSEAAWHTAQSTQAVRDVDYAWLIKVAKVYELQTIYVHMHGGIVDKLTDIDSSKVDTRADVARQLVGRVNAMAEIGNGLDAAYAEILDDKR